ncbi:MAG: hypothetical protein KOO63_03920 [Bacteroidales bacterium]|nr:hypothetical protein [Candidatus Latescibacterota bacterium]
MGWFIFGAVVAVMIAFVVWKEIGFKKSSGAGPSGGGGVAGGGKDRPN